MIYNSKSGGKLRFSFSWVKKLFNKSKYFIISSMMVTIFAQTDKIMLRFMNNDVATGIYAAANSCAGMSSFVFAAIIDSMRPAILDSKRRNDSNYELNLCRLYAVIISMAVLQSITMTLLAKHIISILYGQAYMDSVSALRIIVWHTTFSYVGAIRNIWMLAEGKHPYVWIINLSGALGNIMLNFILIPSFGVEGAAIASVITQIFTNFVISFIIIPIRYNNVLICRSLQPRILITFIKTTIRRCI